MKHIAKREPEKKSHTKCFKSHQPPSPCNKMKKKLKEEKEEREGLKEGERREGREEKRDRKRERKECRKTKFFNKTNSGIKSSLSNEGNLLSASLIHQPIVSSVSTGYRSKCSAPNRVLPYICYTGMCRCIGYGFWPCCLKQGVHFT